MSANTTILLLPGNMCDERMWQGLLPSFAGRETTFRTPREDTVHDMACACLESCPGTLLPIGFSMGAIVALAMAVIAPDRLSGLGLISTNAGADRPDRSSVRRRQQSEVRADGLAKVVMDELKPVYFGRSSQSDNGLLSLVLDMAMQLGPDVFISQSEALRTRRDYRRVLEQVDAPVLIACGEEDTLCPPDLHAALAATSRNCELHVIPGAGHMLPLEQPKKLGNLLSKWLCQIEKERLCPTAS